LKLVAEQFRLPVLVTNQASLWLGCEPHIERWGHASLLLHLMRMMNVIVGLEEDASLQHADQGRSTPQQVEAA
jgi:hypothetical protein